MIYKTAALLLSVINLLALFFYIDGYYIHPGSKTISRYDLQRLIVIDIAFVIYYLSRKKALQRK